MKFIKRNIKLLLYVTFVACAIILVSYWKTEQLTELINRELSILVRSLISEKMESKDVKDAKEDIKKHTMDAIEEIQHLFNAESKLEAKEEAKKILASLKYKSKYDSVDGYFFVYDFKGTNIVHPIKKSWIGQNKWDYQDKFGKYVIRDLIKAAREPRDGEKGGFDIYIFHKPVHDRDVGDSGSTKLSYVIAVEDFEWILGTGIHLDLVDEFLNGIDSIVQNESRDTIYQILFALGLGVVPTIFLLIKNVRFRTNLIMARKLHTNVKQDLGYLARKYDKQLAELNKAGLESISIDRSSLEEQSEITHNALDKFIAILKSKDPGDPNLVDSLKSIKKEFETKEHTPVLFSISDEIFAQSISLPKNKKQAILNIATEALANIGKHAAASQVEMQLQVSNCYIILSVCDNGIGFDINNIPLGMGFDDMRASAEEAGGYLDVASVISGSAQGTKITAKISRPINDVIQNYVARLLQRFNL